MDKILIDRRSAWEKIGFSDLKFLSSAGSFGCNFTATYEGAPVLLKFVFVGTTDQELTRLDVAREAFIGHFLKTVPPPAIASMFAGTKLLVQSMPAAGIPDEWLNLMDETCAKRASHEAYVLVQDFVQGQSLLSWVGSQPGPISAEIIRSVLFQMTLALAYVHHAYGFQHNDVKPDNIMCIPTMVAKTKTFLLDDSDVFEFTIPAGGVEIVFIDFGASALITSSDQSTMTNFLRTDSIKTPEYVPFDKFSFPALAMLRKNDADITGIFMTAICMVAHRRFKFADGGEWIARYNFVRTVFSKFKNKEALTRSMNFDATAEEDVEAIGLMAVYVAIAEALQISFEGDTKEIGAIPRKLRTIVSTVFRKEKRDEMVAALNMGAEQLADNITSCFGPGTKGLVAIEFLRLLFAPWECQRQAFGVLEAPFEKHCLANALYHPFFAYEYWLQDVAPRGVPLGRIGPPLVFTSKAAAMHATVNKAVEAYAKVPKRTFVFTAPAPASVQVAKPDLKKCVEEMRKLTVIAKPIPANSPDFYAKFQECINRIEAAYDKSNPAAGELLQKLGLLDANKKAAIVTASAKGSTGFNFFPVEENKKEFLHPDEVVANAAIILLGIYVALKLAKWESKVPALFAEMSAKDANDKFVMQADAVAAWVTKNLAALFETSSSTASSESSESSEASNDSARSNEEEEEEEAPIPPAKNQPSGLADHTINSTAIKVAVDGIITAFFDRKKAVPDDISAADLLVASTFLTEFANMFNGLEDELRKFVVDNAKAFGVEAASFLSSGKAKHYIIGVYRGKSKDKEVLKQNDGNPDRPEKESVAIISVNGKKSDTEWSGDRFYYVIGSLLWFMKFVYSTLNNRAAALPFVDAKLVMKQVSGRKQNGQTVEYITGKDAMDGYKQMLTAYFIKGQLSDLKAVKAQVPFVMGKVHEI